MRAHPVPFLGAGHVVSRRFPWQGGGGLRFRNYVCGSRSQHALRVSQQIPGGQNYPPSDVSYLLEIELTGRRISIPMLIIPIRARCSPRSPSQGADDLEDDT